MGNSVLVTRNNATGYYEVKETHTFTSSFETTLNICTSSTSHGSGTNIADGYGKSLSGTRTRSGTSYGAVTVTDTWYFWVKGASWQNAANTSFSYTVPAAQFTATFDDNYTGGSTSTKTEVYGQTWVFPTNPTRSGYSFTGWNTAVDGTGTGYAPGDTVAITANTTLYAQWSPMSILHVVSENDEKTITNIKVKDGENIYDIIGCYSVKNGDVHQGV